MKTILHPDYWVEIPAGDFQIGLSDTQRDLILARARNLSRGTYQYVETRLTYGGFDQKLIWVDRFYIARFRITERQYELFCEGTPASDLPGALEEPLTHPFSRWVKAVQAEAALRLCREFGGRPPDGHEWEKAARGTDGRLYPWGDEWNPEAGFFYYGQAMESERVDAFPRGVSPYGVWAMVGGLSELVGSTGKGWRGCHARESSAERAWFDHIVGMRNKGHWVSLRPVLDQWSRRQWRGFQAGLAEPNAEALQRMGPLADLLLTQFDWSTLETKLLDTLEPAIVALREGRKAESQDLLTEILHNDPDNEAGWLLQAAALEDVPKQRECVQRALTLNPDSEVGQKMMAALKPPVSPRSSARKVYDPSRRRISRMKTLLHPDYWVEVPAGDFQIGLSDAQRDLIRARIRSQVGYENFTASQRQRLESIVAKFRQHKEGGDPLRPVKLSDEEDRLFRLDPFRKIFDVEYTLMHTSAQTPVWLDRFYIARFPITKHQYGLFHGGMPADNLPGALEEPLTQPLAREADATQSDESLWLCQELGGRLPTGREWMKAARGTDGRLYPWGDEWDPEAGFFYYGQPAPGGLRVDAFPRGVNPYGVWAMAGGLPELVGTHGRGRRGCHARESSAETAWFDHILTRGGRGLWVSLRPVLDEWPRRQWPGFQAGLAEPSAEALQKMGPLADLLLTQFNWSVLETKVLDILEPAIVALREARKAESQALLTEILHNDPDNEAGWLLQAAALEDVSKQQECVQRVLALNPKSEVGWKMGVLLKPPARVRW